MILFRNQTQALTCVIPKREKRTMLLSIKLFTPPNRLHVFTVFLLSPLGSLSTLFNGSHHNPTSFSTITLYSSFHCQLVLAALHL